MQWNYFISISGGRFTANCSAKLALLCVLYPAATFNSFVLPYIVCSICQYGPFRYNLGGNKIFSRTVIAEKNIFSYFESCEPLNYIFNFNGKSGDITYLLKNKIEILGMTVCMYIRL